MTSPRNDIVFALVTMIASAIFALVIVPLETIAGFPGEFPQQFMPLVALGLIFTGAAILLVRSLIALKRARPQSEKGAAIFLTLLTVLVVFGITYLALRYAGFVLGGSIVIALLGLLFDRRRPISVLLLATLMPYSVHFVAINGLGLALP